MVCKACGLWQIRAMDSFDTALRLLAATTVGVIIGLNRDWRGRPAGMRTMGLVALGAAMLTVTVTHLPLLDNKPDAVSRVIQGVIQGVMAGIGFLGGGVLIQSHHALKVHGMTTAAAIWATAALGITAGLAAWPVFLMGSALVLLLLIAAHPLEKMIEDRARQRDLARQGGDEETQV